MSITEKLKSAIHAYGTVYRVAKDSGVSQPIVQRFVAGERDIRLATADRLAELFGLELSEKKTERKTERKTEHKQKTAKPRRTKREG